MAYDLSVIGDVVARLNRAGKPGVSPGAWVGDGAVALVHICPKRLTGLERARLRGIGAVFIL